MRQIKAVFLDIDGTIISIKNHTIPQSAIDAISRIRVKGVNVFLCTSRAKQFLSSVGNLQFDGYICLTGAHCIDSDGKTIKSSPMNNQDIVNMLKYVQEKGKPLFGIAEDKLYVENDQDPAINKVLALGGLSLDKLTCSYEHFPDFINHPNPEELAKSLGILQLTAYFGVDEDDVYMPLMPHSHTERWDPTFSDIVSNGVGKSLGIKTMSEFFGFDASETMAVGDGGNDISMIKYAAVGVAMGNASDEVKAVADFVTDDVDEDGLQKAIDKFIP